MPQGIDLSTVQLEYLPNFNRLATHDFVKRNTHTCRLTVKKVYHPFPTQYLLLYYTYGHKKYHFSSWSICTYFYLPGRPQMIFVKILYQEIYIGLQWKKLTILFQYSTCFYTTWNSANNPIFQQHYTTCTCISHHINSDGSATYVDFWAHFYLHHLSQWQSLQKEVRQWTYIPIVTW